MKKDSFFPLVPKLNSQSALFRVLFLCLLALASVNVASFLGLKDTSDPTTTLAKNNGVVTKDGSDGLGTVDSKTGAVLGVNTLDDLIFAVKVPAVFNDSVRIGNLEVVDSISAPNIIKKLKAGLGISVSNPSNADGSGTEPVVTNTGVLSLQGETGAIILEAGTGMSIDGLKLSNDDLGSSQAIFKTFSVAGQSDVVADSNTDTLRLIGSGGITITTSANDDSITINSAAPDYTLSGWTKTGTVVALTTPTDAVTLTSLNADSLRVSGVSVLNGGVTLGNGTAILPDTDLGSDLGSADYRFNNLWVGTINSNSSVSYSGQTKFTYEPKDTSYTESSVMINPTAPVTNGQLLGLGVAGYQRALIDEDGDISLGYADATSAPVSDYPLNIYGHSGTRVSFVDTSGNGYFAGNVGIGTTAPGEKLHVVGDVRVTSTVKANNYYVDGYLGSSSNSNYGQINFLTTGTKGILIKTNEASNVALKVQNTVSGYTGDLQQWLNDSGNALMVVNASGNVGIGTTSPAEKLHVFGNMRVGGLTGESATNPYIDLFNAGDAQWRLGTTTTGSSFFIGLTSAPAIKFIVNSSGNVGIGTTSPTQALTVNGNITTLSQGTLTAGNITNNNYRTILGSGRGNYLTIDSQTATNATITASSLGMDLVSSGNGNINLLPNGSGNVGIGTTSPIYTLDVNGNFRTAYGNLKIISSENIPFVTSATGKNLRLTSGEAITDSNGITINAGNVGIGTSTPGSKFDVAGTIRASGTYLSNPTYISISGDGSDAYIRNSGNNYIIMKPNNGFAVEASANGTRYFVVNNLGNVGIGTTSPQTKLEITGTGQVFKATQAFPGTIAEFSATQYLNSLRIYDAGTEGIRLTSAAGRAMVLYTDNGNVQNLYLEHWSGGKVGVGGYPNSGGKLQVFGGMSVGSYAGTADAPTNGLIVSGNVGIGTTTPSAKLQVSSGSSANGTSTLYVTNNGVVAGTGYGSYIEKTGASTTNVGGYFGASGATNNYGLIVGDGNVGIGTTAPAEKLGVNGNILLTTTGNSLRFTNDSVRILRSGNNMSMFGFAGFNFSTDSISNAFNIISNGNVGIGTTSPTYPLDIVGNAHLTGDLYFNDNKAMKFDTNNFIGHGATSTELHVTSGANIWFNIDSNNNSINDSDAFIFAKNRQSTSGGTELMRISENGNVGIGTTTPATALDVVGSVTISSLTTGTVYSNAGVLTNTDPSDRNLKNNILTLEDGTLDKLMGLRPVSFKWKNTGDGALGFIAQEVNEVFPELVGSNADGTLGLYTTQFIPVLAKAIQEQQLEIDGIAVASGSARITELEDKISSLTAWYTELKKLISNLTERVASLSEEFFTKKSHQEQFCIGTQDKNDPNSETCLTKDQVDQLLKLLPSQSPATSPEPTSTPTPVSEPTPSSEPEDLISESPSATEGATTNP